MPINIKRLIDHQIKQSKCLKYMEYDDAYQEGYKAYLLAEKSANRPISIFYLNKCVGNHLKQVVYRTRREKFTVQPQELEDVFAYDISPDRMQDLHDALQQLSTDERLLIEQVYFTDPPRLLKDIADDLGVSSRWLREMLKKTIIKLKAVLVDD